MGRDEKGKFTVKRGKKGARIVWNMCWKHMNGGEKKKGNWDK